MTNAPAAALKICSKCGRAYPATPAYFYRNRASRDGLRSDCKACRDAWREAHPDAGRIAAKNYRQTHPDAPRRWNELRRDRLQAAPGHHTRADELAQRQRQRNRCYYCGARLGQDWTIDHVIPISRGGSDDPSNLVAACPACNLRKYAKMPHEWPACGRLA